MNVAIAVVNGHLKVNEHMREDAEKERNRQRLVEELTREVQEPDQ